MRARYASDDPSASGTRGRGGPISYLDGGDAAQVEEILSCASVAGSRPLARRDVSETVFDGGSFAEAFSAGWGRLELSQPLL